MSSKKFKETKIGKMLTSKTGRLAIGWIPVVGDIADNILTEVKGDGEGEVENHSGKVDWKNPQQIIRGVVVGILLYLALTGKISWEDADQVKDFID